MFFTLSFLPSFDFLSKRYLAFAFSTLISLASVFGLMTKGLNFGIDFNGGILIDVNIPNTMDLKALEGNLSKLGYNEVAIQEYQASKHQRCVMIRLQQKSQKPSDAQKLSDNQKQNLKHNLQKEPQEPGSGYAADYETEINSIKDLITEQVNHTSTLQSSISASDTRQLKETSEKLEIFNKIDYVGPKVGKIFVTNAIYASIAAILAIVTYICLRFQWQFSIGAILALTHDVIVTLGFYVLSGLDFDLTSIAALLTVVGYSINDSVVIYDRIRENLKRVGERMRSKKDLCDLINSSINQTLSRTIMTVGSTAIVVLILLLCATEPLRGFCATTLFGILFGTYSSIWISAPILTIERLRIGEKAVTTA